MNDRGQKVHQVLEDGSLWDGTIGVDNAAGTRINPATEEGVQDIVTAIENIPGGGGVQYTEGDVDASVTGTAVMWKDSGNVMRTATASTPLPISVTSSALPTGAATLAEQQTQTASLSVLDDWDESDRAKVNIIAGQAGVQGGTGSTTANTQRVTMASDDSLVLTQELIYTEIVDNLGPPLAAIQASVQILDDWDESDRAKVNPIVGQAGVQGGSGAVSANTQRMVLATDVGLPAGTNPLGTVAPTLTARSFADSNVSVGTSSVTVVASNASRKDLTITNTSPSATVSLNVTDPAVLRQGYTLVPGATWRMTAEEFTTAAITGIASAAATSVSVMELT